MFSRHLILAVFGIFLISLVKSQVEEDKIASSVNNDGVESNVVLLHFMDAKKSEVTQK